MVGQVCLFTVSLVSSITKQLTDANICTKLFFKGNRFYRKKDEIHVVDGGVNM